MEIKIQEHKIQPPNEFRIVKLNHEQLIQRGLDDGFGAITARCHGINPVGQNIIVSRNFITGDPRVSPIPDPQADAYLNSLAISASGSNETVIALPPIPGILELYEKQGVIQSAQNMRERIIAVNPQIENGVVKGHPYTDPISLALLNGVKLPNSLFAATFPTDHTQEAVKQMGMVPIQQADHVIATKAHLRQHSEKYGIKMFFGHIVKTEEDLILAISDLNRRGSKKIWIKIPYASGGDGVMEFTGEINEDNLRLIFSQFKELLAKAFEVADFSNFTLEDLWPVNSLAPDGGLVIEQDAADSYGENYEAVICSNALEIDADGTIVDLGDFEQITPNGSYLGSMPILLDEETKAMVEANNIGVAKYVTNELGHYGILGTDYILIREKNSGRIVDVGFIEINLRDPISWDAQQAALKVFQHQGRVGSFLNTNLTFPTGITSIEQLRESTTIDGYSFLDGDMEKGMIIPIAVRSIFQEQEDGNVEAIFKSPVVKCIIVADNDEQCFRIRQLLKVKGIQ